MALALGSRASMVNLNAADPNSLTSSMRKLQQLRERILTHGVADTIRDDIMEIYEEDTDAIERALNKSYMIGGELTNLCIEVVSLTNNSVEETKKIIDVLIDLGADINRWDTQDG